MNDEGFHEIHLSGKQLVFLFMATTVVSVVIFLCGVFVGRGVRAEQPLDQLADSMIVAAPPAPSVPLSDTGPQAVEPPSPPTEAVELSYKQRLEGAPPRESISVAGPAGNAAASSPRASRTPAPRASPTAGESPAGRPAPASPAAAADRADEPGTWVVQVHALRDRNTANGIVQRLVSKGYPAFLVSSGPPTGIYRVQVGRFKERQEAERTLERLKKEEKFDPWITR